MDNLWDFNRIHSWEFNVGNLEQNVTSFLVGCYNFSSQQPVGLAGFGSEPTSLPSQLGLTKFSFCCLSHEHDDVKEHQPCFGQRIYGRAQLHTIAQEPYVCRELTFSRVPLCEARGDYGRAQAHQNPKQICGSRIWRKWRDNNWHWGISHVHGEVNFHFGGTGVWGSNGWSWKSWWCRSFGAMFLGLNMPCSPSVPKHGST